MAIRLSKGSVSAGAVNASKVTATTVAATTVAATTVAAATITTGGLTSPQFVKLSQTVAFGAFTDGLAAVGTYAMTAGAIPVGATFLFSAVTAITGFAGDTSAVMTIGDGTDVDRYNTGTVNVFTTAAAGVATGVPSGVQYHAAAKTPVLTVTTNADFTSVSAGSVTVELYYLT